MAKKSSANTPAATVPAASAVKLTWQRSCHGTMLPPSSARQKTLRDHVTMSWLVKNTAVLCNCPVCTLVGRGVLVVLEQTPPCGYLANLLRKFNFDIELAMICHDVFIFDHIDHSFSTFRLVYDWSLTLWQASKMLRRDWSDASASWVWRCHPAPDPHSCALSWRLGDGRCRMCTRNLVFEQILGEKIAASHAVMQIQPVDHFKHSWPTCKLNASSW